MTITIPVPLLERSYEVVIGEGLLDDLQRHLPADWGGRRLAVVADETVASLYGERVLSGLGLDPSRAIVIKPGEAAKSFEGLSELCRRLLALKLERSDAVVALGGGVVGDLAGFAAAIYKRGVDYIQIPTTLLAQVDSSVGGKTAIDTPEGKNLIGAFHQPRRVVIDLEVLSSLNPREIRCGYAEIVKYGLLGDADFFAWLEDKGGDVLALRSAAVSHAVARSIEIKAEVVAEDERESGRRALLNLGHTFGHALEAELGFSDALLHGEAVSAGLCLASRFSAQHGLCSLATALRAAHMLQAAGLPTSLSQIFAAPPSAERLYQHMLQDKKAHGGAVTLILLSDVGRSFVARRVERDKVVSFLLAEGAV
jgi:3-dehydroquinate synthase